MTPVAWTVPRLWEGRTVACIGGGPSLSDAQVCRLVDARMDGVKVLAVNDAYRRFVPPDALYFCDHKWFGWHRQPVTGLLQRGVPVVTLAKQAAIDDPRIHWLEAGDATGLSDDPTKLAHGSNSGHQAVNLAYLLGAARILLVGYDMQLGPKGETHWFGEHPVPTDKTVYAKTMLPKWPPIAEALQRKGVAVVNCSPGSALAAFRQGDLARELARCAPPIS